MTYEESDCESDHSGDESPEEPKSPFSSSRSRQSRVSFLRRPSTTSNPTPTPILSPPSPPRDIEEAAADNACTPTHASNAPVNNNNNNTRSLSSPSPQQVPNLNEEKPPANPTDVFLAYNLSPLPLPPKKGTRFYRHLRHTFLSIYCRLFCLVFLANTIALIALLERHTNGSRTEKSQGLTYHGAITATTSNLLAAVLIRNEHVVNTLFWTLGTATKYAPLRVRSLAARVYTYGGVHSGGAVAAVGWYVSFLVLLTRELASRQEVTVVRSWVYFVAYAILAVLVSILCTAHPKFRRVMHDWFEVIHRFGGWLCIILFWVLLVLLAAENRSPDGATIGKTLVREPNLWMLVTITGLVVYPWTRLRKREVQAEVLSPHCVKLTFRYRNVQFGQAVKLTDRPFKETHAFGVIPLPTASNVPQVRTEMMMMMMMKGRCSGCCSSPSPSSPSPSPSPPSQDKPQTRGKAEEKGFSVIVSKAGDWTSSLIAHPPSKIYTRGVPQFGVLRIAALFRPVLLVATGSGIAPILSLLIQVPHHPVRIVWSTHDPEATYGRDICDVVYRSDPHAVVVDTSRMKRPDLVKLCYRVWEQEGCEAVVVISNQRVTRKVVYGLESRGVRAFGPIFDS